MHMRINARATLAGLAVAGGAAAALALGPAGTAVGQSSAPLQLQIQVTSPATLVAKGAGVDVNVTTQCSGAEAGTVEVGLFLTERVGSDLAVGAGSEAITCTGASQTSVVLVQASASGKAFKKGAAIAQGTINGCTPGLVSCSSQEVEPTIEIVK
jgi:hypothetical protein